VSLVKADMPLVRAFIIMHAFLKSRGAIFITVATILVFPVSCSGEGGSIRQTTKSRDTPNSGVFESIELKRRNWENHGTNVDIDQNGSFTVTAEYLGRSKLIREGRLSADQLDMLYGQIEKAGFFNLPNEYKTPFKTGTRWWGYHLTIKTNSASKSVRFHSEDETVPDSLARLLEMILNLTK
jgi:hypothetical protein